MAYNNPLIDMKRFLLLGTIMLCAHLCFSQTQQSVLGINPNTTMKNFNAALLKKGIKPTQTATGLYEYKVTYAGYPNCRMEVMFNSGNDSVRTVTIDIPHESVAKDKAIFENLTKQFREKYGHESDLRENLIKIEEDFTGRPIKRTRSEKSYGVFRINQCNVNWYFDDDEYEDGVEVKYHTKASNDKKVSVNSDI